MTYVIYVTCVSYVACTICVVCVACVRDIHQNLKGFEVSHIIWQNLRMRQSPDVNYVYSQRQVDNCSVAQCNMAAHVNL